MNEKDFLTNYFQDNLKINEPDMLPNLEKIIEYSPSSIFVTDGSGNTFLVNRAFEELTGIGREEVLGKNVVELEAKGFFNPSAAKIVLEQKKEINIVQKQRNGEQAFVSAVPIFNDQEKIEFVVSNTKSIKSLHTIHDNADYDEYTEKNKIIYKSEAIKEILDRLKRIASVDSTVLLLGESGVGKNVFAKYIHNNSNRKNNPLVEINSGAIPDSLLESELFGYEGGSFTGANNIGKKGLVEVADKGTLFLDEIGDLSMNLQVKILKLLQDKEISKIGSETTKTVDVRIICATNKNLIDPFFL